MHQPSAVAEVPCNLCGAREVTELSFRDRRGRPLRTVICRRCGLVWSDPRPPAAEVDAYYAGPYRREYKGAATPAATQVLRSARIAVRRGRELQGWLRPGAAVLDVGAGGGELVYVLRRLGFDAQGVEPDPAYAAFARDRLGVPVQHASADRAVSDAGRFAAVTMYHMLEHVVDPTAVLTRARGWLAPGGLLVVEVPNVEATCQAPAHRFHFAHFHSYNAATLEALGRQAGCATARTWTSEDGGNVTVVFRTTRTGGDAWMPPNGVALPGNAERILAILGGHTTLRHYCSPVPYVRAFRRAVRHLEERRAVRRLATPREIADYALVHMEETERTEGRYPNEPVPK